MPGLEIDQRRAPRRGGKMGWYYITAGRWLQLLLMCCCTFMALFPVFIVARFIPAAQETQQHMLNLESSQQLAAMNNMEHHHVKSNMIISAGAASKDNDQDEAVQKSLYPQHRQAAAAAAAAVARLPHDVNLHHMRRLSTLKAHAPASSSGHEEEILMERILYNFDHSDYVDPGANTDPGVPSLPSSGSPPGPPHKQ